MTKQSFTRDEYMEVVQSLEIAKEYIDDVIGYDAEESETVKHLEKKLTEYHGKLGWA